MEAGKYLTTNLDTYLVPTTLDAPQAMRTYVMEALDPGDPHGPRGIGELAIGAIAPAIISAVADATGAWITRLPLDPEGLLNAVATEEAAP
jgi:CO/xanthine dehydrogenase Mo-binding subunit